jgi:7-cyano-7-deazaguanine synthase
MQHQVVIYSGGMDSYTLLREAVDGVVGVSPSNGVKPEIHVLSFYYGQRHSKELEFATTVCNRLGLDHKVVNLGTLADLLVGESVLLDHTLPMAEGHYEASNMKQTIVPGRNGIMLAIAAGYAEQLLRDPLDRAVVLYGAHSGDHHIYPDCRPEFYRAMQETIRHSSDRRVRLYAPYMDIDKTGILEIGLLAGYDYSETWTCYAGGERACGRCGSCQERLLAFLENSKDDPLDYETRELLPLVAVADPQATSAASTPLDDA